MGGAVLYLLLILKIVLAAELPQLHQFVHFFPSVKSPTILMQNKHVQQGWLPFTSLSRVPRVHTVLFFNPLREGGSASQSEIDSEKQRNEGGFLSKSHVQKENSSCAAYS